MPLHRYSLYDTEDLPDLQLGEAIEVVWQDVLLKEIDTPPKTSFRLKRRHNGLDVDVLEVLYEELIVNPGRARGVHFSEYIAQHQFLGFYQRSSRVLMLRTSKNLATGAVRTLAKYSSVRVHVKRIELKSIAHLIDTYKGAWFSVRNSANVSAQALFGQSVELDHRFMSALKDGEIKSIRISYADNGNSYHIGISDNNSVVIYGSKMIEEDEVQLVLNVKAYLLDQATLK